MRRDGLVNLESDFFFNDTATTEIYTLSLHDALPICARRPHGKEHRSASADGAPGRRASSLSQLESLAEGPWRKVLLSKLSLAVQHQLERVAKVYLRFFESLSLRNGCGNLFHEAGVSTLFGWFKHCRQFHDLRLSQRCRTNCALPVNQNPPDGCLGHPPDVTAPP